MSSFIFNINDFKESARWFVCANTPSYLLRHLRQLQEVESLSNKFSAKELYEICRQIEVVENNQDNELAFYICLTALSFKIYSESSEYLNALRTLKYKWTNSIIELIIAKANIIIVDTIDVKHKPEIIKSSDAIEDVITVATEYRKIAQTTPKIIVGCESFKEASISDITINIEVQGENEK